MTGMDKYAGNTSNPAPPELANLLDIPDSVSNITEAMTVLDRCDAIVKQLLDRVGSGSVSTGLVIKYEVVQLIGHVFCVVLPRPTLAVKSSVGVMDEDMTVSEEKASVSQAVVEAASSTKSLWSSPLNKKTQVKALETILRISLTYGTVWQSIETPTRTFDSERAGVVMCMLAIFDAVVRTPASDNPLAVTELILEKGGCALSTTVCQNSRTLEKMSSTTELCQPSFARARNEALEYLVGVKNSCGRVIFDFRMPEKLEIKKYSATVMFLRSLIERCGYQLSSERLESPLRSSTLVPTKNSTNTPLTPMGFLGFPYLTNSGMLLVNWVSCSKSPVFQCW